MVVPHFSGQGHELQFCVYEGSSTSQQDIIAHTEVNMDQFSQESQLSENGRQCKVDQDLCLLILSQSVLSCAYRVHPHTYNLCGNFLIFKVLVRGKLQGKEVVYDLQLSASGQERLQELQRKAEKKGVKAIYQSQCPYAAIRREYHTTTHRYRMKFSACDL